MRPARWHRRSGVVRPLTDFETWYMKRHRQIEPSARNLSTALSTIHATFADADLLAAANTDALVADLPVLDTGEPHLARRSLRYRRAAKMRRQYLEERRDGRWPLPTPTTFLS